MARLKRAMTISWRLGVLASWRLGGLIFFFRRPRIEMARRSGPFAGYGKGLLPRIGRGLVRLGRLVGQRVLVSRRVGQQPPRYVEIDGAVDPRGGALRT